MATDLEQLVVQLSADFKSFENALTKASGLTKKEMAAIKASAEAAAGGSVVAFTGASKGVQRFGAEAQKARSSVAALKAQTGNLAAQFQDIGVQLAGGQSPFQIALQQGTQISAVLGGQGARGAVTALAGAFASLVSPVSLVTIGLIAAGGAAVQYFAGLLSDGEKSAEELKRQNDLIRQVGKEWGAAVPAVQAYVAELERAQKVSDLREAGQVLRAEAYGSAREQVEALSDALVVLMTDLSLVAGPEQVGNVSALQQAFNALRDRVEDNSAAASDAEAVQDALNRVMGAGAPTAEGFAASLAVLAGSLGAAATEAARAESQINAALNAMRTFHAAEAESMAGLAQAEGLGASAIAEQERLNGLTAEQLRLESEISRTREAIHREGGIATPAEIENLAKATLAAEDRRKAEASASRGSSSGGRTAAASAADREREAVSKLIEQLRFEQSLIGLSDLEREKANALRRAGAAATLEQRAQIEQIVAAIYEQTEAIRGQEDQLESLKGLSRDVLGGMFEDLRDGAKGADILANALNRVAESLVTVGLDNLVDAVFAGRSGGGAGGGLLGGRVIPGILHSGGVAGRDGYGHGKSYPAALWAKAPRFHRGGEVPAILLPGERVLNRRESAAYAAGARGAGGRLDVRMYVDENGNLQAAIDRRVGPVAVEIVRRTAPAVVAEARMRNE